MCWCCWCVVVLVVVMLLLVVVFQFCCCCHCILGASKERDIWKREIVAMDSWRCCYGSVQLLFLWVRISVAVESWIVAMGSSVVAMNSCSCCYGFVPLLPCIQVIVVIDSWTCLLTWRLEVDDMDACECRYGFGEFLPWNRENVASAGSVLGTFPCAHRRHKLWVQSQNACVFTCVCELSILHFRLSRLEFTSGHATTYLCKDATNIHYHWLVNSITKLYNNYSH